jgi:hypothetical protein
MARLELTITYKMTVWFYVLKLIGGTGMIRFIKEKTIAKCSLGKDNNIKVSDIIAI